MIFRSSAADFLPSLVLVSLLFVFEVFGMLFAPPGAPACFDSFSFFSIDSFLNMIRANPLGVSDAVFLNGDSSYLLFTEDQ